jgi:hypothetical protein
VSTLLFGGGVCIALGNAGLEERPLAGMEREAGASRPRRGLFEARAPEQ